MRSPVILFVLLLALPLWATGPPAPLDTRQALLQKQAERCFAQASAEPNAKRVDQHLALALRGLELEKRIHGEMRLSRQLLVRVVAQRLENAGRWKEAEVWRGELLRVVERRYGKDHWRTVDPRRDLRELPKRRGRSE